jgi:hypothetical protein
VKTPSWDEILEFLKLDRWAEDRSTGHDFFEKVLPNGEILHTHSSRSGGKTISPGRFKAILSDQLRVSETEFWETLRTGKPAGRPSLSPEPPPASLPLWIVEALVREVGLTPGQIGGLGDSEARALIDEAPARPRRRRCVTARRSGHRSTEWAGPPAETAWDRSSPTSVGILGPAELIRFVSCPR